MGGAAAVTEGTILAASAWTASLISLTVDLLLSLYNPTAAAEPRRQGNTHFL